MAEHISRRVTCLVLLGVLGMALPAGCKGLSKTAPPTAINQYHAAGIDTALVHRVLLMPLSNESRFPAAADQMRQALAAELQDAGLFEVVLTPDHVHRSSSRRVRAQGSFDEAELADWARYYRVGAVLFGTVTQYRPYQPQRIGLILHLVSTEQAVVLASIDGLWDSRDQAVAQAAALYYQLELRPLGDNLVLQSPNYYERFVAHEIARGMSEQIRTSQSPVAIDQTSVTELEGRFPPAPSVASRWHPTESNVPGTPVAVGARRR